MQPRIVTVTPRDATEAEKAQLLQWFLNKSPAGQQMVLDAMNGAEELVDYYLYAVTADTSSTSPRL